MNPTTALRALADHLDRHPHLDNQTSITAHVASWHGQQSFRVQVFGGSQAIANLLAWYDTLGAPSITLQLVDESVHPTVHGLMDNRQVEIVDVADGAEADLLRTNFTLTDKPVTIPVHRLRALVDASVAEHIERPIVDPALIGGAR